MPRKAEPRPVFEIEIIELTDDLLRPRLPGRPRRSINDDIVDEAARHFLNGLSRSPNDAAAKHLARFRSRSDASDAQAYFAKLIRARLATLKRHN